MFGISSRLSIRKRAPAVLIITKCAPAAGLVLRHFEVSLHCDAFQPAHNMFPLPQRADALKYKPRSSNSGEILSTVVFPCSTFFTFGKTGTGSGALNESFFRQGGIGISFGSGGEFASRGHGT